MGVDIEEEQQLCSGVAEQNFSDDEEVQFRNSQEKLDKESVADTETTTNSGFQETENRTMTDKERRNWN